MSKYNNICGFIYLNEFKIHILNTYYFRLYVKNIEDAYILKQSSNSDTKNNSKFK